MKLISILQQPAQAGDVLVGRNLGPGAANRVILVHLEESTPTIWKINRLSAILDDDDESSACDSFQIANETAPLHLAHVLLELGDPLIHRGRPAQVLESKPRDWHVRIQYTDATGGEFYGNLIWMDLGPVLNLVDNTTPWPALP